MLEAILAIGVWVGCPHDDDDFGLFPQRPLARTTFEVSNENEVWMENFDVVLRVNISPKILRSPIFIDEHKDWLLLAGFYPSHQILNLKTDFNVSRIINMAHSETGIDREVLHKEHNIMYLGIAAEDDFGSNIMDHWEAVKTFTEDFLRRRRGRETLLIHCLAGINRSVALAVAMLCWAERKMFSSLWSAFMN